MAKSKVQSNGNTADHDDAFDTDDELEADSSLDMAELPANFDARPEGYEQIGSTQAPYMVKYRGAVVSGELVGRFLRSNPSGMGSPYFYQIRLDRPAKGVAGSKKKGTQQLVDVGVGELLSIDEMASMKDLAPLCEDIENGAKYSVCLKIVGKIETAKGNKFWDVRKFQKQLRAPHVTRREIEARATGNGRVIS